MALSIQKNTKTPSIVELAFKGSPNNLLSTIDLHISYCTAWTLYGFYCMRGEAECYIDLETMPQMQ